VIDETTLYALNGNITEHWGVATLLDLMQQLGVIPPPGGQR
jgi:hypothetical protein